MVKIASGPEAELVSPEATSACRRTAENTLLRKAETSHHAIWPVGRQGCHPFRRRREQEDFALPSLASVLIDLLAKWPNEL